MALHQHSLDKPILIMGVCGTGKTTIGDGVAQVLDGIFLDADDYHPSTNVARMQAGLPLDDAMRMPWLDRLANGVMRVGMLSRQPVIFGCSALKRRYRDHLRAQIGDLHLVYLNGAQGLIAERMAQRREHYMPLALLESQLAELEPPALEEQALSFDIAQPPEQIIAEICRRFAGIETT